MDSRLSPIYTTIRTIMSGLSRAFFTLSFATKIAFNKLVGFVSRTIIPRMKMTVILEQGALQGQYYTTRLSNKPYVSFLGVPYAKPPIDDLRFRPPVKHPGWSGVLNAFSEGGKCMQYPLMMNHIVGSEDCLYLNIFVPQDEFNENKAVMVFIHGGGFNFGSASLDAYCPDYLLDENVIVVTLNYRLNVLGFLNFDIDECPGNMGLKDQLFAIKWVKANISAFGGDPDNITIFGESAGAASVHCHTLSPQSTGLFQRAIMQSGCIFNPWAFNENHKEAAFKFAKKVGCQEDDPSEIIQYLKKMPAIDLVKGIKVEVQTDFLDNDFVPSLESNAVTDPFLSVHPKTLVKTAPNVPIIIGINDMEGLIGLGEQRMEGLVDFHKTEKISRFFKGQYSEEVINKIKNFYFNEQNVKCETTRLENMCHFYSDFYFIKDFDRSYNYLLGRGVPTSVYVYEFKFDGDINSIKNVLFGTRPQLRKSLKGACHADELNYLFYVQIFGFAPKPDSPESRMCKTMSELWCNFAKTGNPNSSDFSFVWHSTSVDQPKYLTLDGDNTCSGDGLLYSSRANFWENI